MESVWNLPSDIIYFIAGKLYFPELIRFGCVCSCWRSISAPIRKRHLQCLILVNETFDSDDCLFFSPLDGMVYLMKLRGFQIRGFSNGSLVVEEKERKPRRHRDRKVQIHHLFSREVIIDLPPSPVSVTMQLQKAPSPVTMDMQLQKACMSSDLSVVLGIFEVRNSNKPRSSKTLIFFCKPKIKIESLSWILIETYDNNMLFHDICYYNGKFYALYPKGIVVIHGLDHIPSIPFTRTIQFINSRVLQWRNPKYMILVESAGDLLMVFSHLDTCKYFYKGMPEPNKFEVEKIDLTCGSTMAVEDLGDYTLFVSPYQSCSVSTSSFPRCSRNSIYSYNLWYLFGEDKLFGEDWGYVNDFALNHYL